jgi:nucleoside-diphosphate-sugar epimerase
MTILEFAQQVLTHFKNPPEIVYQALPQDDPNRRRPDISKARRLLGWEPKVKLEQGLRITLDYFEGVFAQMNQAKH